MKELSVVTELFSVKEQEVLRVKGLSVVTELFSVKEQEVLRRNYIFHLHQQVSKQGLYVQYKTFTTLSTVTLRNFTYQSLCFSH